MEDKLVANELLAFLQQKLDVMDEVSAIQICASSFSEDEIAASKVLLFRLLNKSDQMVSRRRDGTKKSLQDIITLMKVTDPDDIPSFVARDLNKLPPVTFDHVDVTSLLKDIVLLKASLADVQSKLAASENTVTELRKDVIELRNIVAVSNSPSGGASNINVRRGAGLNTSAVSFESAVLLSPTPSVATSADCVPRSPRGHAAPPAPAPPPRSATRQPAPVPVSAAPAKSRRDYAAIARSTSAAPPTKPAPEGASNRAGKEDGFVTVQRRKRRVPTNQNRCGKAPLEPNVTLRAAQPNTPVYISRLHYSCKAEDIEEYVHRKLKYRPRVQLLESRRNVNFKAFVVRVPTCYLSVAMDEGFWPQGVVFRRFRGQVPHEHSRK